MFFCWISSSQRKKKQTGFLLGPKRSLTPQIQKKERKSINIKGMKQTRNKQETQTKSFSSRLLICHRSLSFEPQLHLKASNDKKKPY